MSFKAKFKGFSRNKKDIIICDKSIFNRPKNLLWPSIYYHPSKNISKHREILCRSTYIVPDDTRPFLFRKWRSKKGISKVPKQARNHKLHMHWFKLWSVFLHELSWSGFFFLKNIWSVAPLISCCIAFKSEKAGQAQTPLNADSFSINTCLSR